MYELASALKLKDNTLTHENALNMSSVYLTGELARGKINYALFLSENDITYDISDKEAEEIKLGYETFMQIQEDVMECTYGR
jgi:hypothetical protein